MRYIFGYSESDWENAKKEVKDILIKRAQSRNNDLTKRTISYSELAESVKSISIAHRSKSMSQMLEEISREEDEEGRGMLSVLVVGKSGDKKPGPGFYTLAKSLGRNTSDQDVCWSNELEFVCSQWAKS